MVSKLKFKNDGPSKKKRKITDTTKSTDVLDKKLKESSPSAAEETETTWVSAEVVEDLNGPCMILLDSPPLGISSDSLGKLFTTPLASLTPRSVQQVFVLARLPLTVSKRPSSTSTEKDKKEEAERQVTLKSHLGKYLSVSKFGGVDATAEAIGPEQIFEVVKSSKEQEKEQNRFALRSVAYDKYLAIDVSSPSSPSIRCDSDSISQSELFHIRIQSHFRHREPTSNTPSTELKIHTRELEERVGAKLEREHIKLLKAAYREGRLNEAIIEVREKIKGDHRC
ncbi:hypothetical protein BZA70DRAFT_292137 [Myxozyma melibiosi]|uniref:Uncharacterized protein n=1 Tax=Myxozyma melibiosi TaxID=54550 RepID=A0ABR1EYF2_9ASCO